MTEPTPRRCGLTRCQSGLPARPYPCGWRCDLCNPSMLAGEIHPDEIVRRRRDAHAESRETS